MSLEDDITGSREGYIFLCKLVLQLANCRSLCTSVWCNEFICAIQTVAATKTNSVQKKPTLLRSQTNHNPEFLGCMRQSEIFLIYQLMAVICEHKMEWRSEEQKHLSIKRNMYILREREGNLILIVKIFFTSGISYQKTL